MSLYILDLFGVFAFAVSGALLGVKKDMDIYGYVVLAVVAAVGGGTVRDILLEAEPFVFSDINYTLVTFAAVFAVAFFSKYIERGANWLMAADAVGLGVFTVIGATKAMDAGLSFYAVIMIAVLTGTGGGMIRDVLANEVPIVLSREVYASACIVGAMVYYLLASAGVASLLDAIVTASLVTFIRVFTYVKNYHLPRARTR